MGRAESRLLDEQPGDRRAAMAIIQARIVLSRWSEQKLDIEIQVWRQEVLAAQANCERPLGEGESEETGQASSIGRWTRGCDDGDANCAAHTRRIFAAEVPKLDEHAEDRDEHSRLDLARSRASTIWRPGKRKSKRESWCVV